jgi:ABC-2 type transport system permease protein
MRAEGTAGSTKYYDSSKRGFLAVEELRGVIKYRELIYLLVRRDVISRYKRSVFGFAWTMLNPLGTMLILTFVFSKLFHSINGYPVYLLSGLIAWIFFSQTTTASLSQNVWGGSLLHKIYLPRTAFTVSAIGTGVVNLILSLVPLFLILLITRFPIRPSILFLPVAILILAFFALGIGLLFSTLALYFPDVVEMYQIAITAWMYLTPIIYPVDILSESYRHIMLSLNPMYYFVTIFRQPIYDGILPNASMLITAILVSLLTFILGWVVFTWKANDFTYHS